MKHFWGCKLLKYEDFFLIKGLNKQQICEITSNFSPVVTFEKGDIVYSSQNFSNAIGFITRGVAVAKSDNENETHLKNFEKGMSFGAAAVFGGEKNYISTITAKTDLEVLFITEAELLNIFEKYPQTAVNYITFLSEKVRFLNKKLNVVSSNGADNTLYKYLTSQMDINCEMEIPKNMTLLSKTLGISRASLYRALNSLEAQGSIIKNNNKIKVIKNEKNY